MITTRDAVMILEQNGFRITNDDSYGEIMYNDERVGTLYADEVYIASEFPHLRVNSYKYTKKQGAVRLDSSCARSDLEDCIQVLFKSPAAFEEEMRNERVKKVRRYFDSRR
jgi:hypothetical protein